MMIASEHHLQIHTLFLEPENHATNANTLENHLQDAPRVLQAAQMFLDVGNHERNKEVLGTHHNYKNGKNNNLEY